MISLQQDVFFKLCALDLVIVYNHIFSQWFHCIDLLTWFLFNQEYFPEGASSNYFSDNEILEPNFIVSCFRIERLRRFSELCFSLELISHQMLGVFNAWILWSCSWGGLRATYAGLSTAFNAKFLFWLSSLCLGRMVNCNLIDVLCFQSIVFFWYYFNSFFHVFFRCFIIFQTG